MCENDDDAETLHLLRTPQNAERLRRSIKAAEAHRSLGAKPETTNGQHAELVSRARRSTQ
ncbi:MAG: hypothetical protein QOF14_3549 [Hyphomicrobiales bacterium]|jgi:hypothetical protein|nr:hypothetical protein [Hyphomicrobiales bacterium]